MTTLAIDLMLQHVRSRPFEAVTLSEPVPVSQVPTPALIVNGPAFERNVARMQQALAGRGKLPRPHGKTHKCPIIALRQLAAGAVGICVAKVSEAAVMVHAGVNDVLITSPLASRDKMDVVAQLALGSEVKLVVDDLAHLDMLQDAVSEAGARLGVLVDLDVSMGRTGTRDPDVVRRLLDALDVAPALFLAGFQHYAGHLMHVAGHAERRARSLESWERVGELLEDTIGSRSAEGCAVTGAGTGTYDIDVDVPFVTDLQVGSYVFMDAEYRAIEGPSGSPYDDFEPSLTVVARAISQPLDAAVTVDCGFKAMASDTVPPEPLDLPGWRFRFGGDEHGILIKPKGSQEPLLGQQVRLITSHCDPTVNLYDYYWLEDDGLIRELWPITARGCTW